MNMRLVFLSGAAALLVAVTSVDAAAIFVTPAQYDATLILPAPPPPSTADGKAELAELKRYQAARTPERLARAKHDNDTTNASSFAEVIGPGFDLAKLPATAKALDDVRNDEKTAADAAKAFFKRDRPWIVDDSMQSCHRNEGPQSSYPSGHSTMGYSLGVILAHMVPEKARAILARSREYAESRMVCGMHFRSDIVGGQTLGTLVAMEMLQNPAFKAEFDAAVQELRAAKLAQ